MIKLYDGGAWLIDGKELVADSPSAGAEILNKYNKQIPGKEEGAKNTIAYSILENHNTSGNMENLKIKFDKDVYKRQPLDTPFTGRTGQNSA